MKDLSGGRELLRELVSIGSVSGYEEEAASFLVERLPRLGWERVRTDEAGNVLASRGDGPRVLVLMGHIDTVPGGPPVRLEGDVLWGRGSVDAKGPFVAMALAGAGLSIPAGWQVLLIGAVGEERDSRGAKFLLSGLKPSGCVIGEPSGTTGVTIGYRGRILVHLTAGDSGAHRSGDAGPSTAVVRASVAVLDWVEGRDLAEAKVIERPFGSVLSMEGGEGQGRSASVELDIRLPLGVEPGEWFDRIGAVVAPFGVEVSLTDAVGAHQVPRTDPLARAFVKALREGGEKPVLLVKGGTADFNLAAQWKCPMVAYGPGDSKLDHSADERLDMVELDRSVELMARALPLFMEGLEK